MATVEPDHDAETLAYGQQPQDTGPTVRRAQLSVVEGPRQGLSYQAPADRCAIGSHPSNDLVVDDPTVSRFHCEVVVTREGRVRDLDSTNGTVVDGVRVAEAFLREGSLLRLGRTVVRFDLAAERNRLRLSDRTEFGTLVGRSIAMRTAFALLERAARTDVTVLLEGETGTGKERAARGLHEAGARRKGPLVVVDCSAIPANLLETQLFGHEKGAFTGAESRRIGAFEEANGGTIFLDEIGELPPDLQPKLLRVLEAREIRRLGSNADLAVDLRVIAATNRDLRAAVNAGSFRPDLYYRLAVVRVALPPVRSRPDDIPLLVESLLQGLGADGSASAPLRGPEFLAGLARAAWPGNVRELRNHLERCLVLDQVMPPGDALPAEAGLVVDASVPYARARDQAIAEFERHYAEALLRLHGGKVTAAAKAAGMDRRYLHRLLKRHGRGAG